MSKNNGEKLYDIFGRELVPICKNCEYRHSGGCTNTDVEKAYNTNYCENFEAGYCFKCAIFKEGDKEKMNELCDFVFFPAKCSNYKKG